MKKMFVILVFLVVGYWIVNKAYTELYINAEKKPFWEGTEQVQVCKVPYYASEDCRKMLVTLIDEKTARINFPNGDYKVAEDLTCYFAARAFKDQPRYVFCRSWDGDNQQWDLMPTWAYYPSGEDLMREMEKYNY